MRIILILYFVFFVIEYLYEMFKLVFCLKAKRNEPTFPNFTDS